VFTLRFPYKAPLVFVAAADALDELLQGDPQRAHAGAARRAILPQASTVSPFGGDAAAHQASRARMWPGFSSDRIAVIEPQIAELAAEHVRRWPVGRPFQLLEAMRQLCTEITVRAVLGVRHPARSDALVDAIRSMLNTPGNPPLPLPGDDDGPWGIAGRAGDALFARRAAPVRNLLQQELRARRGDGGDADDVLDAMRSGAELDDDAIVDELLIVLMAAQEPPAIALANVLYELARRPQVAGWFDDEVPARRRIVAEVLRLRPSASAALRRLTEPMVVAGHELAEGTDVACPSLLLHRDPHAFADPNTFEPDRFINGPPPGAPYMPFGGGARRCLGEALAEAELRAVLPAVRQHRRLRAIWPREERMVIRATVLVPHRGALISASSRG
jgi:cytochrome P450